MNYTVRFNHPTTGELTTWQMPWVPYMLRIPIPLKPKFTYSDSELVPTRSCFRVAEYELHKVYDGIYDYWRVR